MIAPGMISIIIPTLNEAERLPALLAALDRETAAHEVIVADGGSGDGTPALAIALGARLVCTRRGRGQQLAAGAEAARGEILLFLHADTAFPEGGLARVAAALAAAPARVGGNFRLVFDGDSEFSRWLTGFYAWLRARGIYYGDSGVFVRRRAYEAIGGIRPIALMEDYDFTRRLEAAGETCCIEAPALVTSSRRFAGREPWRIRLGWIWIHALYYLGVPPEILARLYDSERRRQAADRVGQPI